MSKCTKTSFRSEAFAELAIAKFRRTSNRQVLPVRSYFCFDCNNWHISSAGKYTLQKRVEELEIENEKLKAENKALRDNPKLTMELHNQLQLDELVKAKNRVIGLKDEEIRALKKQLYEVKKI